MQNPSRPSLAFHRSLFGARDIIESTPVRIVNWRVVRLWAAVACAFWAGLLVCIIVRPTRGPDLVQSILFICGAVPATITVVVRFGERFKVDRHGVVRHADRPPLSGPI